MGGSGDTVKARKETYFRPTDDVHMHIEKGHGKSKFSIELKECFGTQVDFYSTSKHKYIAMTRLLFLTISLSANHIAWWFRSSLSRPSR